MLSGADLDPFLGKWKLNWDKSHSSGPAPSPPSGLTGKAGDGVHVSETWIDLAGKRQQLDYQANYDGKEYAISANKRTPLRLTKPTPFTVEGVSKTDGKVDRSVERSRKMERP